MKYIFLGLFFSLILQDLISQTNSYSFSSNCDTLIEKDEKVDISLEIIQHINNSIKIEKFFNFENRNKKQIKKNINKLEEFVEKTHFTPTNTQLIKCLANNYTLHKTIMIQNDYSIIFTFNNYNTKIDFIEINEPLDNDKIMEEFRNFKD